MKPSFCKKCQTETERYECGSCRPCAKANNAAQYAKNPGKVKAATAAWRSANPDRKKLNSAVWRKNNPEKARLSSSAWRENNTNKARAATASWNVANPEKASAYAAAWRRRNPEAVRIFKQNYRARKRADGGKLSKGLEAKLLELQKGKCPCCNQPLGDDYHMDHIMPLALGGSNTDDNIQLLRSTCNHQKSAKHPVSFMQSKGFLI